MTSCSFLCSWGCSGCSRQPWIDRPPEHLPYPECPSHKTKSKLVQQRAKPDNGLLGLEFTPYRHEALVDGQVPRDVCQTCEDADDGVDVGWRIRHPVCVVHGRIAEGIHKRWEGTCIQVLGQETKHLYIHCRIKPMMSYFHWKKATHLAIHGRMDVRV